jgi:alkylmercury lyase
VEVRAALRQVGGVDWDEHGRVVGVGLTLRPTPHRFRLDGRTLYTWCALDALMFPALLGRPATVESPCRGTGEPVRVEVTPTAVGAANPPSAVVSFVAPRDLASVRSVVCECSPRR